MPDSEGEAVLASPQAGEIECLAVLWQAHADGETALRLSEIHRRIGKRRADSQESPPPALTTVSTQLRSLASKGLIQEVVVDSTGKTPGTPRVRTGGLLTPPTRSPLTGYRASYEPGEVLLQTYRGLARVYPKDGVLRALADFARAIDVPGQPFANNEKQQSLLEVARALHLPDETVRKLEKILL
jgi:hypothetical protein